MRSLITGGAGFIGSHLVDYLLSVGDEVVILDDLSSGTMDNLAGVVDNPKLTIVEGSILDRDAIRTAIAGCDRVFHLAAVVGVKLILDKPLHGLRVNLHGTENVLDAAVEADATVLLVSTSEIYGKNTADKLSEDSDRVLGSPLLSRWTYAAAKGLDESLAQAYIGEYGLKVAIVRLFNTVGPRQRGRYGMVFPNFVGHAMAGSTLGVFGTGEQTRCFSYVGDVVPAMVRIAEHPDALGEAFNLGGAREISIGGLASEIISALGSNSDIALIPYEEAYPPGFEDMQRRVPDNSKAEALVGYDPATPLPVVIERVAQYITQQKTGSEDLMSLASSSPSPTK